MLAYHPNVDTQRSPKLLERMRIHLRTRHYSIRTEEAYIDWARRFILFHGNATRVIWVLSKLRRF